MINFDTIKQRYRTFWEEDYPAFVAICNPDLEWTQRNPGFYHTTIPRFHFIPSGYACLI